MPFAALLILGGRLGDVWGRRRVFQVGVTGFVAMSLLCAVAPSMGVLLAGRAVQGASAALVIPQTLGLIRALFTGPSLGKALSTIGPVMGLAAVLGPVLGGVLTTANIFGSSWRSVFLVNVPLGVAVLAFSGWLTEDRAPHRPRLDVAGTLLAAIGMAGLVYPLIEGQQAGWPVWVWLCLIGAAGIFSLLAVHLRRATARGRDPLVATSLFNDRGFPAALLTSLLLFAAATGLLLVIVVQVQVLVHAPARTAGLTLLPWSAGLAAASLLSGLLLIPRFGNRTMFLGLTVFAVGTGCAAAGYSATASDQYPWLVLPALLVCGIGVGLATVPFFTVALSRVEPHETGSASGLLNSVQQLGGTLGVAVLGSLFFGGTGSGDPQAGAVHAFIAAAGFVVAAGVTGSRMTPLRSPHAPGAVG